MPDLGVTPIVPTLASSSVGYLVTMHDLRHTTASWIAQGWIFGVRHSQLARPFDEGRNGRLRPHGQRQGIAPSR